MISTAKNITSLAEQLQSISVEQLFNMLRNPDTEVAELVRSLQIMRTIDPKRYAASKRALPYVVCAGFNPPYRRTENFTHTGYFIVDIDHIAEAGHSIIHLRTALQADPRVMLCFVSPSGDGLKLLFRLKEQITDPQIYSIFYKEFVRNFAMQYNIAQCVDTRTSDVCRACFLSVDQNAYYNAAALEIDSKAVVDTTDTSFLLALSQKQNEAEELLPAVNESGLVPADPDQETMNNIRQLLSGKAKRQPVEKPIYIPKELAEIIDSLCLWLENLGFEIRQVRNIQYAKKIIMRIGHREAEINLFFGKNGFTTVISPRSGTDPELNQMAYDAVEAFLAENC